MKLNIILLLLFSTFLFGCSISEPEPEKKVQPPPAWFVNPSSLPADPRFLYGTANSSNRERAMELALKDIASSLSVSISSSTTANRYKSGTSTSSSFQEQVKSEVAKIEFSGQKVEQQELINNKYYVRVSVPKSNLTQKAKEAFSKIDNEVQDNLSSLNGQSKVNKFFTLRRTKPKIDEGYSKLLFLDSLRSIDPFAELDGNSLNTDITRYESYLSQVNQVSQTTKFSVVPKSGFESSANTIAQELSSLGISAQVSGQGADGTINVSGTQQQGKVQGFFSVTQNLTITVTDEGGKNFLTKNIAVTGYSPVNHDLARENVGPKLKESFDKEGGFVAAMGL